MSDDIAELVPEEVIEAIFEPVLEEKEDTPLSTPDNPEGWAEEYRQLVIHDCLLTRREKPNWDECCDLEMDPAYVLSPWNHPELVRDEYGRFLPGGNRRVNSVHKHTTDNIIPKIYREQYEVIRMASEKEYGTCPEDLIDLHEDLTAMQRRFVMEYSQCHSAQTALKRMYGKTSLSGTDKIVAYKLANDPLVKSEIDRISVEALTYLDINSMQVLLALAKIAFADMGDYVEWDENGAKPVPLETLRERGVDTGTVEKIVFRENKNGNTFEMKLYNKADALQALAKVFKMVPDQLEVKNDGNEHVTYVDTTESLIRKLAGIAQRSAAASSAPALQQGGTGESTE